MAEQSDDSSGLEIDREEILEAEKQGTLATLWAYTKQSGPGWLQGAITIGGGSLAGGLMIGILGGASLLWVQPIAMILGIIMLSAIAYITLTTEKRPFGLMWRHISPVLAIGWIVATIMANIVWSLPQFTLATSALKQNLFPGLLGEGAEISGALSSLICVTPVALISLAVVWLYDTGFKGVKYFEWFIRGVVGLVVLSFIGVVIVLSVSGQGKGIKWGNVFAGYIPDFTLLWSTPETYTEYLQSVADSYRGFWEEYIIDRQFNEIITAAAVAVGINMTFLMPYSLLKKGWGSDFRGLAIFDLSTGLFIPFILVTSCIVIASVNQFHTEPVPGLVATMDVEEEQNKQEQVGPKIKGRFIGLGMQRIKYQIKESGSYQEYESVEKVNDLSKEKKEELVHSLPESDQQLASMLVKRDTFDLADSLAPLTGKFVSRYVFGIGVIGVAISTIIILMLINGFAFCELFNVPSEGLPYKFGAAIPVIGMLGPYIWAGSGVYLAVPTSVFGMVLLPVAYVGFFLMMNSKRILGDAMPTGGTRLFINILMGIATTVALLASFFSAGSSLSNFLGPTFGYLLTSSLYVGMVVLIVVVELVRREDGEVEGVAEI